nr:Ldh family oxidoreductase [Acinetobacter sp. Marseille-Q1620]
MIELSIRQARELTRKVLTKADYSPAHIEAITDVVLKGQMDECASHGLYRLLNCIHTLKSGKASADTLPVFQHQTPVILKVDAQKAMAPLALKLGIPLLIDKAKTYGIAMMALNNCVHFSALWYEMELITQQGLVGFACTSNHAWVTPTGGSKPLFGTNPIAFGWPRLNQNPYIFDFATTAVARGEIELYLRNNRQVPEGWGVDENGKSTTDPLKILKNGAMLTFGEHKGSALATMVELLAGPLIGDLLSTESIEYDDQTGSSPFGGELIIAFSPETILGKNYQEHLDRAEKLFHGYMEQGARLPSQRRYEARKKATKTQTVKIQKNLYDDLMKYLQSE